MSPADYVELRCRSAFSFLDGASLPEDLAARAAALQFNALAIADRDGLYAAPRFHGACARVAAESPGIGPAPEGARRHDAKAMAEWTARWPLRPIYGAALTLAGGGELLVLVENPEGWRNLSRLVTRARIADSDFWIPTAGKVDPRISPDLLGDHARGLIALAGGGGGSDPLGAALARGDEPGAARVLHRLIDLFGANNVYLEVERHFDPDEELRNGRLLALAARANLPVLVTNDVRYAAPADRRLHDVLTCTRHGATVDEIGRRLAPTADRHLKAPAEMARLFADLPGLVRRTREVAERCRFTLLDLAYRFPEFPVPRGETEQSYLEKLTFERAQDRFRPFTQKARAQLERELQLIGKLKLAGYFLIVWDLVAFCRRRDILVQGRGSAANSAVCYALGITAVDPVRMELLFERFLSEERGEWPDIDLDLPSGERREEVIQYVYSRYGPRGVALTANVITYRPKMAVRDVGRALGFGEEQLNRMSRQLATFEFRDPGRTIESRLAEAGFSTEDPRTRLLVDLAGRMLNLPRHLGQHSGGMVIAAGALDEIVPIEPASMPGRVIIQWDKDDCADLGLIKIDLLGLGMMAVLKESVDLAREHEHSEVDLAHLPEGDPAVYELLQKADTVGLFQVESRAQMSILPRMHPTRFYDLVIQVAIIRPGPIVGDMLHPYLRRRTGREAPDPIHPTLENVLARTLGVPLFQEQLMRIAMTAANFSGGEAEELRRAMGSKRSVERMNELEKKLRAGMTRNGIDQIAQDKVVKSITSFALYGFPESHAASFALLAYASAYLKVHHGPAFYAALLNNWPMGFYHPATLVRDGSRRKIEFRPIDVTRSHWLCTLEPNDSPGMHRLAVRIGLRYVRGLREEVARRLVTARAERPFSSAEDVAARSNAPRAAMTAFAESGAFAGLGLTRRSALWQVEAIGRSGPLFLRAREDEAETEHIEGETPLDEMTERETLAADYRVTSLSVAEHPLALRREALSKIGVKTARDLDGIPQGHRVRLAGQVIVRQRPGSAKGFFFLTLEDETGLANCIVSPAHFESYRTLLSASGALVLDGLVQRLDGAISIKADRFFPLDEMTLPSRNFH